MLDTEARQFKNTILTPLLRVFSVFTPTQISLSGLAIAFVLFWSLTQQLYVLAIALWSLNRIFDGMDGIVARATNQQTDMGGYVDIMADFGAYALLPLGLVVGRSSAENWMALSFMFAAFYINAASWMYLSALLEKQNAGARARGETTSISIPAGLVGGFLTIVFYYVFLVFPQHAAISFWAMSGLVMVGVFQRLWWANRYLPTQS